MHDLKSHTPGLKQAILAYMQSQIDDEVAKEVGQQYEYDEVERLNSDALKRNIETKRSRYRKGMTGLLDTLGSLC